MVKGTHRGSANEDGSAVRLLDEAETSRTAATAPRRQPPHGVGRQSACLTPWRGRHQSPSAIALFLSKKGKHVRREAAGLRRAQRVSNASTSRCNRLGSVVLTLDELRQITNNFSHDQIIGEGAFGKVYKGVLTNGDMIAVKRFASTITGLQDVQYENEAQHLMRLKHPNIVQLVGYCSETEMKLVRHNGTFVRAEKLERLLCLEYMPKGSLRGHLSDETSGLEWNTRYKIIEGICYGLHYLHEEWQATPIIHMDLKPANILLDDNMVPKIADFGLSRLFGEEQTRTCTTSRKGTPGYMAPEYLEKGVITKEFDIFSLGVIIIEIITGVKDYPTDETETTSQQYVDLVLNNWIHRLRKAQCHTSQDIDYQQIKKCIQIGLLCVKFDRLKRPKINQIVKMLEGSDKAYPNEREVKSPPNYSFICPRTPSLRKHSGKTFDKVTPGAQKSDRSSMLGFNDSQVPESPAGEFSSESPEYMATTSEAIGAEQSNGPSKVLRSIPTWSSKNHLQSTVMPKVHRSATAIVKRKIKEIGRQGATKLDNYDFVRNPSSAKRSEARSLCFSTAGPSNGPNRLASISKKIRKHQSPSRSKPVFSPSGTRIVHGSGEEHEHDTRHVNKKFRVTNNEGPKKFLKHTEENTADNDFSFASDMPFSGEQNDLYDAAQETEGTHMDCEGEDAEADVPYDSVSRSDPADCSNQISDVSLSLENNRTADDVLVECYSVAVEDPNSSDQLAHGHESKSAANNEMDEWQMDTTSTKESGPCLTSNRDMGPGGPQNNSSLTSHRENSNQEHGLPLKRDSFDSPISTASIMSPPAPLKDSRTNKEEPGPSTGRTVDEQITGCLNQETKSIPVAREGEQLPNEKSFCRFCQENTSTESHQCAVAKPKNQVPQLHIGSRASSSFSTYQRTSTKPNPCFDLHDHLLAAKVRTQLPSPSNPILRLMGKNLMVMNNEENLHPQAPSSDYILRGNHKAPVGFMPQNYQHLSNSAFINMPPTTASHQIPLPSIQARSFVAPPLHSGSVMQSDHHSQHKSHRNNMLVIPTYMMKEVSVTNDSPERRSEPQGTMPFPPAPPPTLLVPNNMPPPPFYCLPPQSPVLPRERAVGSMPVYPNVGSMVGANSSSQGSQTEVPNPYMPNPFFAQSRTGYINRPVYYLQNLRR